MACPHPYCSSHCAAVMEAAHTIQRSNQKRIDEVKRIRSVLASGESLLTDAERNVILSCAQVLEMDEEGGILNIL
jgi:hypothetical protein